MQHRLAAISAGRPATRFTVPLSRLRQRRLGIRRSTFEPTARRVGMAVGGPRDELRRATRSCAMAARVARPAARQRVQRVRGVSWSGQVDGPLRQARPRSAAPWRC